MNRSGLVASVRDAARTAAEAAATIVLETVVWADVAAAVVAAAAATGIGAVTLTVSVSEAAAVAGAATSRPRWERDLIAQAARIRASPAAASRHPTFSAAARAALIPRHVARRVQVHDDLAELADPATTREVLFTLETCETGHHGPTNLPDNPVYQYILTALTEATSPCARKTCARPWTPASNPNTSRACARKLKRLVSLGLITETEPGLFALHHP